MTNMANVRKTKIVGMIRNKWFVKGFNDCKKNLPFDETMPPSEQWPYERGRLFGAVYNKPIKFGKKVSIDACWAFADLYNEKAII
jgi:hypothetical protein